MDEAREQVGYVMDNSVSTRGSKAWATKIRKRAKALSTELDTGYMEMAKILYEVFDCPVDGDPKNLSVISAWGHSSFKDYVENELGMHYKKATRLRAIWYVLEVHLKDLDPRFKERLVALGASKMRELVRVLSDDNIERWLEIAEREPYTVLLDKIQRAVLKSRKDELTAQLAGSEPSSEGTPFPEGAMAMGGGEDNTEGDGFEGADATAPQPDALNADTTDLFGAGELKMESFMLAPQQQLNVLTALERAGELTKSTKKGHNLDMICLDFLATNDFVSATKKDESRSRYLAKVEQLLGIRIIAVDAKRPTDVVYGINTLSTLSGEGSN
jgi:hypothetical protein